MWDSLSPAWLRSADVNTSGKKLTDVRKNCHLRWSRPDGKTQVTIEYVPQVMEEIVEVVRLIPQERVQQRTMEPPPLFLPRPVVRRRRQSAQIIPQERISKRTIDRLVDVLVTQRQVPTIQTVKKTVKVPQAQFLD